MKTTIQRGLRSIFYNHGFLTEDFMRFCSGRRVALSARKFSCLGASDLATLLLSSLTSEG